MTTLLLMAHPEIDRRLGGTCVKREASCFGILISML